MAWQPPEESFDDTKKSQWSPPEESFDDAKRPQWSPPEESFDDSPTKIEDLDKLKELQSTGQKLTDKQQRILFDADDERSFMDKASGVAGAVIPTLADTTVDFISGGLQLANKAALQPLLLSVGDTRNNTEKAQKVFKERDEAIRSGIIGMSRDIEETANMAVRGLMFGTGVTDKLLGKSKEERFRRWQDRQVMRDQEAQSVADNPDRTNYLLSQNPLIQAYVGYEAEKMGLPPEEVEKVKQDYIQSMLDSGLTKDQINEEIATFGEFRSPVSIPGVGLAGKFASKTVGKALSKVTAPIANKIGNLPARAIGAVAGGTEFAANKVLQGTEFTQTVAKNIGQYAINDPDTWIKGTVNTAILPIVAVAKPVAGIARVVKDIARQVDVGGTAGRRGILERTGDNALSGKGAKGAFGPESKGGVARAKIGDWAIRQSAALVQPGVSAATLNVIMGLPDIETAEDLGSVIGTGLGIGAIGGSRLEERVTGLIDPRTTMAQKITNLVTPDPAAYRRDEDADIKRFMAQATPEIQKNIADLSNIDARKTAIDATIANLEKKRDSQINPDDAAFDQMQIDGFLRQKEALSKSTPETQAEATRQTALAFIDAYDLAQSTGGIAGLRGINIAVLDPNNADQFFRNLYGDSLNQAETTVNLLTGIPSLTETDSTKLTEARQLLQRFQTDVEGAKSVRGFAIQEDNTDPNSNNFVPPHLRRINQQGATAVINADLIKHLSVRGFNLRHTLQHEVQHAVQQFSEVQKMLSPLRGQLFDQKIKNDDGTTEVYQKGIYSDEDLDRYATRYANLMSPSDNGASFYAQFGGEVDKMRAYIKDEILSETAAAAGEYSGGTRASLDDVGRNVMDWLEVKTKSGRLKQLKEALRRNGVIFDNIGATSSVLNAQMSPETLAMMRQYQRGLKDFDGTMTVQESRESDEPDIPLTKILGSVALQNKYRHADFFEKEQIIKATAPDGSVTEIVVPAGAKIDPFIDVYRTQGGQLIDADGNVVTLGPEITFGSMPDGTKFETDTRIARKSDGSPKILVNREMKARARKRTEVIQIAIDSASDDGSGVRLSDTGNGNYRGVMSPAQIKAFMLLPNEVVSPNLKRMTKFFNTLMAKNDGTRVVMEYQAALLNGKYKALSPKIRDEIPIGFQLTKDGNFAVTTISVSRLYDKMQAWADKKPSNMQPWGGDTNKLWESVTKYLDNHANGLKGETGLSPDPYIAGRMKNRINDLFNEYNADTKQSNPERSTLPRARGKDNLDIVIRSRRLDRINNFEESPSQKLPINYGFLTTNYMPAANPAAAPMTAEEVQNRFDGSVTATRVRQAITTGEIDALESELRQMDDLLPTESLQLVQGEGEMPRIQIVSMFDPENVASLEPEEIVSDIDAETEAELAILDAQDGTVPPQDIAKVLSSKLDQLYADGGRSPIIPALESELEKIYQQLESQAQEQAAATEDVVEAPETTEVDIMNSPQDLILAAVDNYNTGKVDNETQTLPEYIRSVVNEAGSLQIPPDVTDEQIVAAADDVMQYRQSLKDRIRSGTQFSNAVVAPAGLQYLPAFHASRENIEDKFNINFVNTGNKEQVYGWGLYFAENKKEIDKFYPLQYQYKVDLDIDEKNILDWNVAIDERLKVFAKELEENIEIETLSPVKIYTTKDYYDALSEYLGDPKSASMQLKEMGFDGIKYLDRISNEKVKEAGLNIEKLISLPSTYNYVIFDDSKIKILDKGDKSLGPITQFMPADFDAEYLAAVESGDMEAVQRMVDEAAKKAGYKTNVGGFFVQNANESIGKLPTWADEIYKFGKLASENGRFETVKQYHRAASYGDAIEPKRNSVIESALRYWDGSDGALANYIFEQGLKGEEIGPFVFAERIGNAPKFGYSLNYRDQTREPGVSVLGLLDPSKGLVKQNDGTFELFNDGERRFVGGFLTPFKGSDGEPLLIGIQFDGKRHQIKSADPVTYDESGNVIPLSQRFQTSPDIRFMPAENPAALSDLTPPQAQQSVENPLAMVSLPNTPAPPKKPTAVDRTMQADAGDFSIVIGGKPGKYGFGFTTVADLAPKVELSEQRKKYLLEALTPRNDELNKKRDALLEVGNLYWENIDIKNKEDKSQDDIQRSEEITDLIAEFMENPDRDFTLNDAAQVAEVDRLTRSINLMNRGMVPAPFKFPVDNREVPAPVEKPADISPDASKEDKTKYAKELAAYEAYVALLKKQEQDVSVGLKSLQGAVATLFKTKKFKEFIVDAVGLSDIQFDNILGTWKFEPEPSFVFSAEGMTWKQAQSVTKWLSVLMTQDAGIAWKPSIGLTKGAPSVYLVHDKKLTDEQILNAFKKAKEVGIDGLSVTVDGRGIKAANFDDIAGFGSKLVEIQKSAGIKNFHDTLVDSFYYDTTSDFTADDGSLKVPDWISGKSINETDIQNQQGGVAGGMRETGGDTIAGGFALLLRRGIDSILIPYAKALAGEGFTFDPDRFAARYGLSQEVADYIREQLYPTTGLSRSVTPILDGTEKFTVPESYYTKGGRLKTSVNDLMYALQKRSADDGFIQPGDYSTRAGQIVAETIVDEIEGHMERASKNPEAPNAIGWYDTALKKMKQKYSQFFPFLNRGTPSYDADKEFTFDCVLGIASQGNNVFENGKMAARVQFLLESGKTLPEIVKDLYGTFGDKTRLIENNLLKLNELQKNNKIQDLDKLLRKKMTVSEWNSFFKKNKNLYYKGEPLSVDGKSDQMVTGFSAFGPKIGSFINNLHGDYTTLTADLWYTRTWNRILGNVFQHAPLKEANQFNAFRKAILEQYRSDSAQSAGQKFEPLLKRTNKEGEKEYFDYMQESELSGISRDNLDQLLSDPQKMLEFATALEERYRKGQYKAKSDLRRAAKNWVENRTDPVDAPRTDLERDFQQDVMEIAQKKLRRKGIDISIADMQAALWYNEKELFGEYGAQVSGSEPADYADAADNVDEIMTYASLFKASRLVENEGKLRTEIVRILTPDEEVALTGVKNAKTPEEYVALLAARKKAEDDENAADKKLEDAELKAAKLQRDLAATTDEKAKARLQVSLEKVTKTLSDLTGADKEKLPDLTGENAE